MAKAEDGSRDERVVLMMSAGELAALDRWRHERRISARAEAIRRLISSGIYRTETRQQFVQRVSFLHPSDAAREACGHPLVAAVTLIPNVTVSFTDGEHLVFPAAEEA